MNPLRTLPLLLGPALAQAHPGHGLPGPSHWHASDVLSFLAGVAATAALALWFNRKK
jgi:hypothetical protein